MVILIICSIFYLCLWISGEGESGPNGESSINVYTLSGVRWITGEKSLCNMGSPVWQSVMNWRDGMAGGEGGSGGMGCVYNYS